MRVLLTGGTGLIGSRLLERVAAQGHDIRVLALPETTSGVLRRQNVQVVPGSLAGGPPRGIAKGVEVVYHLAGLTPNSSAQRIHAVNVRGTEALVESCVRAGVRRFVFTSSVIVYERIRSPLAWPIDEQSPLRSLAPVSRPNPASAFPATLQSYAASKVFAERAVRAAGGRGVEYVILRPASTYWSKSEWLQRLVRILVERPWSALALAPPWEVFQWVHVSDIVESVLLAGSRARAANGVFNIAGSSAVTLHGLRRLVMALLEPQAGYGDWSVGVSAHSQKYDLSRAERVLGYAPKVSLRSGLGELLSTIGIR